MRVCACVRVSVCVLMYTRVFVCKIKTAEQTGQYRTAEKVPKSSAKGKADGD